MQQPPSPHKHTLCRSYPLQITYVQRRLLHWSPCSFLRWGEEKGGGGGRVHVWCGLSEKCTFYNEVHRHIPKSKLYYVTMYKYWKDISICLIPKIFFLFRCVFVKNN
jgi:hypothetical protein